MNIKIALAGNPNSGKTSFFNHATGLHEHVGNYAGVTVDSKVGTFYHRGYTINLVDLPGTYSITEYSPEELYVRKYIVDEHPDVVLNIVDASNLERNLFLTTQLIDMNLRVVMALNMYDELEKSGAKFDYNSLGSMLGCVFNSIIICFFAPFDYLKIIPVVFLTLVVIIKHKENIKRLIKGEERKLGQKA